MKKRVYWIDISRALGMLMIIMVHSNIGNHPMWSNFLFTVNVPIFFVLSGYLSREKKWSEVFSGGNKNLLLPYFTTVILIGLVCYFGHNYVPNWISQINLKDFIVTGIYGLGTSSVIPKINLTVYAIGAIWFLLAMYLGNFLFNLGIKLSNKSTNSTLFLACYSLICTVLGFYIAKFVQLTWSLDAALISLSFYFAGQQIRKYDLIHQGNIYLALAGIVLWLLSMKSGAFYINVGYATNPAMAVIGAIGGSYFIMYLSYCITDKLGWKLQAVQYYGKMSLIVLCVHLFDMNSFSIGNKVALFLGRNHYNDIVQMIGLISYRVLLTIIAIIIIPKIPIIRSLYLNRDYPFKKRA